MIKIKSEVKVSTEKKEYPDMKFEDIQKMVKELNEKARGTK
jgi:hypothetical protein